jgi:Ca-activated chloride channel family protein
MSNTQSPITIRARWDHAKVPLASHASRGLLLEVEVDERSIKPEKVRQPVNIALVIDRSGSMEGEPMHAAIEAAVGVAEQLRDDDRLSVVAYDDKIDVLLDGARMNGRGRREAKAAIRALRARATTNLAGGWLQGARCCADVMERADFNSGHVILLSDGMANVGETNPDALATLAANLAERNVTTTCVGIGENYSLLQMSAIAESGQGELHQSSEPDEIIEVLLGELGEQTRIVARNFSLSLKGLDPKRVRQLTRYREIPGEDNDEYFLGNLIAGQTRSLAFLVEFWPRSQPKLKEYACTASWLDAETAIEERRYSVDFEIEFVEPAQFDEDDRDKEVAGIIADLWMARQGYDAMGFNERGLFDEAMATFDSDEAAFSRMVRGLDTEERMLSQRASVRQATSARWEGVSKKEAMTMSLKALRRKPDHRRSQKSKDWTDHTPD